ncbi:MAG: hypothetical protein ACP5JD_07455 [Candidatus Bipolaricaulaceae bacterium]
MRALSVGRLVVWSLSIYLYLLTGAVVFPSVAQPITRTAVLEEVGRCGIPGLPYYRLVRLKMSIQEPYVFLLGDNRIFVADFSRPQNPRYIKTLEFPGEENLQDFVVNKSVAYVITGEKLILIDIENGNIILEHSFEEEALGYFGSDRIFLYKQFLFISHYFKGGKTLIFDISDPIRPKFVGQIPEYSVTLIDQNFASADGDTDIVVFDLSTPTTPKAIATVRPGFSPWHVVAIVAERYLHVEGQVFDISAKGIPVKEGSSIVKEGKYVGKCDNFLVIDGEDGVYIYDISRPLFPTLAAFYPDISAKGIIGNLVLGIWKNSLYAFEIKPIEYPLKMAFSSHVCAQLFDAVAVTSDIKLVAVASEKTVQLLRAEDRSPVGQFEHHAEVTAVSISPGAALMAVGLANGVVVIWNLKTAAPIKTLALPSVTAAIQHIIFSPSGKYVAIWTQLSFISVYDLLNNTCTLLPRDISPLDAAFSPDEKFLIVVKNSPVLYELPVLKPLMSLPFTVEYPGKVAFSPDGKLIAFASDNKILIYNRETSETTNLEGHKDQICGLGFFQNGALLASFDCDQIIIWNPLSGVQERVIQIAWSPDDGYISTNGLCALWDWCNGFKLFDLPSGRLVTSWEEWGGGPVAVSPTGEMAAIAGGSSPDYRKEIRLIEIATGKEIKTLNFYENIKDLFFSADGKFLIVYYPYYKVNVFDIESGKLLFPAWEGLLAVTSDMQLALTYDGITNTFTGQLIKSYKLDTYRGKWFFSPNKRWLVGAFADYGKVSVWDWVADPEAKSYSYRDPSHTWQKGGPVAVSPDSTSLLIGATLFDIASGKTVRTFGTEEPTAVAFSRDGQLIAMGYKDGRIVIWETSTAKSMAILAGHTLPVTSLAFSPDGGFLVSGSCRYWYWAAQEWDKRVGICRVWKIRELTQPASGIRPSAEAPGFTIKLEPQTVTVTPGATVRVLVKIVRTTYFGDVTLGAKLPAGTAMTFNPPTVRGEQAVADISVSPDILPGTYSLTIEGTGDNTTISVNLTLTVAIPSPSVFEMISKLRDPNNDITVTVNARSYLIATLKNRIDPETLQIEPRTDRAIVYLNIDETLVSSTDIAQKISRIEVALQEKSFDFQRHIQVLEGLITWVKVMNTPSVAWTATNFVLAGAKDVNKILEVKNVIENLEEAGHILSLKDKLDLFAESRPTSLLCKALRFVLEKTLGNPMQEMKGDLLRYLQEAVISYRKAEEILQRGDITEYEQAKEFLSALWRGKRYEKLAIELFKIMYMNWVRIGMKLAGPLLGKVTFGLSEFVEMVKEAADATNWTTDILYQDALLECNDFVELHYALTETAQYTLALSGNSSGLLEQRQKWASEGAKCSEQAANIPRKVVDYWGDIDLSSLLRSIRKITVHSPVEVQVCDSEGHVTGVVEGELREEIPNSFCDPSTNEILLFSPPDDVSYVIVGTDKGTYSMVVTNYLNGKEAQFVAHDVPINPRTLHRYAIRWETEANQVQEAVLQIDTDGDGVFEKHLVTGATLAGEDVQRLTKGTTIWWVIGPIVFVALGIVVFIFIRAVQNF